MMVDGLMRVWEIVWQMSLTGGFACLLVCLLRLLMKKVPKSYAYVLWAVVFLRFICPVGLSGSFSVIPQWDTVGQNIQNMVREHRDQTVDIPDRYPDAGVNTNVGGNTGIVITPSEGQVSNVGQAVERPGTDANMIRPSQGNPLFSENGEQNQSGDDISDPSVSDESPVAGSQITGTQAERTMTLSEIVQIVWLMGIVVIVAAQGVRTYRLKKRLGILREAGDIQDTTGICEIPGLATPFVMGIRHPQIYLPAHMEESQRRYVLQHEQTHIRRRDYLVKAIAFGITSIHWFNPLAWLAYYLMCMDMEMSCDERVLEQNESCKKEYAQALLAFAEQSVGGGLAFGEPYAKKRIRNVLQYRRLNFEWSVILVVLCLVISGCLMTDPKQTEGPETGEDGEIIVVDREETEDSQETQDSQGSKETSDSQTVKPSDRLNQDKNQKDEPKDEGPLPILDEKLLARLNTYPQADLAILGYYDQLFEDPYYLAFTTESYTDITKDILWNVAAALADRLGPESEISDDEIQQLKAAGMDMQLDLIWVSTEDILAAWKQCSETTLNMTQLRDHLTGWYYLSETDRWYMQTGGVMVEPIHCVNVQQWGTLTHVIYQCEFSDVWGEILLRGNETEGYKVAAHQRYYSEHFEELYAPEDFYATAVRNMEVSWGSWQGGILNVYRDVWFEEYEGGTLEVLDGRYDAYENEPINYWYESPMYCNDIVYYRPEGDESIDQIATTMMEAMVDRMTVPSDVRPFTITKYRIAEKQVNSMEITLQELWQGYRIQTLLHGEIETWQDYLKWAVTADGRAPVGEDTWYFIPRGYYAFDGVGLLGMTMEDEIQGWPEGYQDGMIPFQAQGGDSVFLFILMKQGDVYRLQRAQGMRYGPLFDR